MPVRRLRPRDHTQWLSMRRCLWPECPRARHLFEMRDILTPPGRAAVFVFDPGTRRLGGFLEVTLREPLGDSMLPMVGYVEGWYVQPRLRRGGIGRALMAAAERWTAQRGLTELASATEIVNRASVRAHRKLGFEESFRLVHFLKKI